MQRYCTKSGEMSEIKEIKARMQKLTSRSAIRPKLNVECPQMITAETMQCQLQHRVSRSKFLKPTTTKSVHRSCRFADVMTQTLNIRTMLCDDCHCGTTNIT